MCISSERSYIDIYNYIHVYYINSKDGNCGEWVECMGVASRKWVWLVGGIYGCG